VLECFLLVRGFFFHVLRIVSDGLLLAFDCPCLALRTLRLCGDYSVCRGSEYLLAFLLFLLDPNPRRLWAFDLVFCFPEFFSLLFRVLKIFRYDLLLPFDYLRLFVQTLPSSGNHLGIDGSAS